MRERCVLFVVIEDVDYREYGCLLLWCQADPAGKQFLQIGCQFDHLFIGEKLRQGDAKATTDGFQCFNRGLGVPLEYILDGRVG